MGDQAPRTLGDRVEAAGAHLFVGRGEELATLTRLWTTARHEPVVALVHGPAGVGKSTLMRAFARDLRARGVPVAFLDLSVLDGSPQSLLHALVRQVGADGRRPRPTAAAVAEAVSRRAAAGGVFLCLDGYEALPTLDRWLRTEVLYHLGAGVLVVVASRRDPLGLWPDDLAWRSVVHEVTVGDLSAAAADRYLRRRGVADAGERARAIDVSGRRPLLLGLCADVLLRVGVEELGAGGMTSSQADALAVRLLDRLAGSRGTSALRDLLDAAAIVRAFDRATLTAMVGEEPIARAWEALVALPVVVPTMGRLAVHDSLRAAIGRSLQSERPWRVRRLRRRAIDYQLARARQGVTAGGDDSVWAEIAHLASDTAWHSWLHPEGEERLGWRFERGVVGADLDQLVACWLASLRLIYGAQEVPAEAPAWVRRLFECAPEGFVVARGAHGEVLGYASAVALNADTEATLLADPAIGAYLSTLPRALLRSWHGRLLGCCQGALRQPSLPALFAIVREVLRQIAPYGKVLFVTPEPTLGRVLELLRFSRQEGFSVVLPGLTANQPAYAYLLDLDAIGYAHWLSGLATPTAPAAVPVADRAAGALEALEALERAGGLPDGVAARYVRALYPRVGEAGFAAWVLDGIDELVTTGPQPLGELLRLYYVERIGGHEAVAGRLDLSRRTYFRRRWEALSRLGDILFG